MTDTKICPNCQTPLSGPFCHECGQRDTDLRRGLFQLIREGLSEVLEVDGKIPRSLVALLLRPGVLTRRWLDGERARYSSPVRLYLFAVVLALFSVNCAADPRIEAMARDGWIHVGTTSETEALEFWIGDPATPGQYIFHATLEGDESDTVEMGFLDIVGNRPGEIATRTLLRSLLDQVPLVLVMMMVLTTAALQLGWWRRYLAEHGLFSLNLHTVGLYALVVALWVPWIGGWLGALGVLVHLVWGIRRVYGSGWPRTLLSSAALGLAWIVVFMGLWLGSFLFDVHQRGAAVVEARQRAEAP